MFRSNFLFYKLNSFSLRIRSFANNPGRHTFAKPDTNLHSKAKTIGPVGWFLILVPTTTFGLGTWQVQRKKWKENLIAELHSRSNSNPIPLPEDLYELKELEYYPIYVRGHFIHEKELYMGPRSLLIHGDASTEGGLMTKGQNTSSGFIVITPFKLADRDLTILVNRGWVPSKNKSPNTRASGQIRDEIDLIGVVRLNENRPTFIPYNRPEQNSWFYRDLNTMSKITDSSPVYLEAVVDCTVPGGPIGGQTRVNLRNEHLSYIFTWYSLCAFTSFMWYRQFIKGLPPI